MNSGGAKTGKLLPTGSVPDRMQLADGRTIRVSLVDAGNPAVFVQAKEIGMTGRELPAEASANPGILAVMEEIRAQAAVMMKLAKSPETASPAIPKVAVVAAPQRPPPFP